MAMHYLLYSITTITSTIPTTAPMITTASTAVTVGTEEPGPSVVVGGVVLGVENVWKNCR